MTGKVLTPAEVAEMSEKYRADNSHVWWLDGQLCVGNSRVFPLAELGARAKSDVPALCATIARLRGLIEGMGHEKKCANRRDRLFKSGMIFSDLPCNCVKSQVNL